MGIIILGIIAVGIALIYVGLRRSHQGGAADENNRSDRRGNLGVPDAEVKILQDDAENDAFMGALTALKEGRPFRPPAISKARRNFTAQRSR